jgi:hypothetical protein
MKKHVNHRDYTNSVKKMEQLTKEQATDVNGGKFIKDLIIIVSPPGFVAPSPLPWENLL